MQYLLLKSQFAVEVTYSIMPYVIFRYITGQVARYYYFWLNYCG